MPKCELRYISPATVEGRWSTYQEPLDEMFARTRVGPWQKYDSDWVLERVRAGVLVVLDGYAGGKRCGFAIVTVDRGGKCRSLILFFAHLLPGSPGVGAFKPALAAYAERWRCPILEFVSSRPGMERLVRRWGFGRAVTTFAGEV